MPAFRKPGKKLNEGTGTFQMFFTCREQEKKEFSRALHHGFPVRRPEPPLGGWTENAQELTLRFFGSSHSSDKGSTTIPRDPTTYSQPGTSAFPALVKNNPTEK
ncbi:hypothetical protein [Akkermansia massiliensis]